MKSFLNNVINTKQVHLDFASTTPVAHEVVLAMKPYWETQFYNPSASYTAGQNIKKLIKKARIQIGQILQVKESEVLFTQGGTESINLALIGLIKMVIQKESFVPHVIISAIEHPAVVECIEYIKTLGVDVDILPVHTSGVIDVQVLEKLLNERTVLVSIIGASNETGVIQPIHKVSSSVKKFKNSHNRAHTDYPFVHSDVSQMTLTQDISSTKLGVDMFTIDGSKVYAPKMSGLLIKKQHVEIEPLIYGGGQEFGLRSGTESVTSIVGITKALELIEKRKNKDIEHFLKLKEFFISELHKKSISFEINGTGEILPNILNICILKLNSDFAVIQLDEYGVNCAAMTSCAGSKGILKSEILLAMHKDECAGSSLRFSFGRETTQKEIQKTVNILKKVLILQKVSV